MLENKMEEINNYSELLELIDILFSKKFGSVEKESLERDEISNLVSSLKEEDINIDHDKLYNYVIKNYKCHRIILTLLHSEETYNIVKSALEYLKSINKIDVMYSGNKLRMYDFS